MKNHDWGSLHKIFKVGCFIVILLISFHQKDDLYFTHSPKLLWAITDKQKLYNSNSQLDGLIYITHHQMIPIITLTLVEHSLLCSVCRGMRTGRSYSLSIFQINNITHHYFQLLHCAVCLQNMFILQYKVCALDQCVSIWSHIWTSCTLIY